LVLGDLADIFDVGVGFHHWADSFIPINLIGAVNLRRDFKWDAGPHSDFDGAIWPFLWCDSAEEREIPAGRFRLKGQKIARQAMMNGSDPIGRAQVVALIT